MVVVRKPALGDSPVDFQMDSRVGLCEESGPVKQAIEQVIELKGLKYCYPDGTRALNDVDLSIGRGEYVALIGPNGAGKSTLLLHLNGLLRGGGEVKVLGKAATDENLAYIRQKVGLVFQDPDDQLFMPTVFDDVAFGPMGLGLPRQEIRNRVERALSMVGMPGFGPRSAHHLSFGEKKRVSIATVLVLGPEILALDEPTSNLDPRARRNLIEVLRGLPMTKIIATHDLWLVRELCERSLILYGGRIVADEPTEALFEDGSLLREYGLDLP